MLKGNKGEWSEIYVFLQLLAEGKLYAADENLNAIPAAYYPIIKIVREEHQKVRHYQVDTQIKLIDGSRQELLMTIPLKKFIEKSKELFTTLKKAKGRSFSFPAIEQFLNSIDIHTLTANKSQKSDIQIVIHDLTTGLKPALGFSIKSMIGKNATLFNAGKTTNFVYGVNAAININEINNIVESPKIVNRINNIRSQGYDLQFIKTESKHLNLNLQLIDSHLPKILAELLLIKYSHSGTMPMSKALQLLEQNNPLNFDLTLGHPFYAYKLKSFLIDAALGMTPSAIWKGTYDATGGLIIVKANGDLVCYHIYNRSDFQSYLLHNTRIEQASTKRYDFGHLYQENGKTFMKLNLQIRFM